MSEIFRQTDLSKPTDAAQTAPQETLWLRAIPLAIPSAFMKHVMFWQRNQPRNYYVYVILTVTT